MPARPYRTLGFIGNCQADLLQRLFQRTTEGHPFRSFYQFYELTEAGQAKARDELASCDVLFVQDIKNCEDYPLRDAIRAETRVLPFPFLWFAAPWPYDDFNGMRDGHARSQDDPALHTVTYYDGALGRLRKHVPDADARLAAIARSIFQGSSSLNAFSISKRVVSKHRTKSTAARSAAIFSIGFATSRYSTRSIGPTDHCSSCSFSNCWMRSTSHSRYRPCPSSMNWRSFKSPFIRRSAKRSACAG